MRRMNYPRFDKPTYVGTFDVEQSGFVMNATPEPGYYFVIIKDLEDDDLYTLLFTISAEMFTYTFWYSNLLGEQLTKIYRAPTDGNLISTTGGVVVSSGSTIELYKLN